MVENPKISRNAYQLLCAPESYFQSITNLERHEVVFMKGDMLVVYNSFSKTSVSIISPGRK
jgi:hypothetical protein